MKTNFNDIKGLSVYDTITDIVVRHKDYPNLELLFITKKFSRSKNDDAIKCEDFNLMIIDKRTKEEKQSYHGNLHRTFRRFLFWNMICSRKYVIDELVKYVKLNKKKVIVSITTIPDTFEMESKVLIELGL